MNSIDLIVEFVGESSSHDITEIFRSIDRKPIIELVNFLSELDGMLERPPVLNGPYSYVGNSVLSGYPYPCSSWECMSANVNSFVAFSALYSDNVILYNPLHIVFCTMSFDEDGNLGWLNSKLAAFALYLIILTAKLRNEGILYFADYKPSKLCPGCLDRVLFEDDTSGSEESNAFALIADEYLERTRTQVTERYSKKSTVTVFGDKDIIGSHSVNYSVTSDSMNEIFSRYAEMESISSHDLVRSGIHHNAFQQMHYDFYRKGEIAEASGVKNIMGSNMESALVKRLFPDLILYSGKDAQYPFLNSLNVGQIVDIRGSNWASFEEFRQLVSSLNHGASENGSGSEDLYRKELLPLQIEIEKSLKKSEDSINRKIFRDASVLGFSLVSSLATLGVSELISAGIGLLGGKHFASSALPNLKEKYSPSSDARNSKLHYVWEINRTLAR